MAGQKASNIIQDKIGPLLGHDVYRSLSKAEGAFTLMFDETTTTQKKRQMYIFVLKVVS